MKRVKQTSGLSGNSVVFAVEGLPVIEKYFETNSDFLKELRLTMTLSGRPHFPFFVCADFQTRCIMTLHAGVHLTNKNCPANYKSQLLEIASTLRQTNIYHNDVHKYNMVVQPATRVITLIDFGWSSFDKAGFPYMNLSPAVIQSAPSIDELFEALRAVRGNPATQ
jgi:thiamine kinase-like enzyme